MAASTQAATELDPLAGIAAGLAAIGTGSKQSEPADIAQGGPQSGPRSGQNAVPAWNRTTIQGFKELHDAARADATAENILDPEAGRRENEQDGPPENAQVGHAADPVERALAEALSRAAKAEQWEVVSRIVDELQARRQARI